MTRLLKYINITIVSVFLNFILSGCRDDFSFTNRGEVISGKEATVSMTLTVPAMEIYTRDAGTNPDSQEASSIANGWVGIFRVENGQKIGQKTFSSSISNPHDKYGEIKFENIKTISGKAYIVAVGNPKGNMGTLDGETRKDLLDLLQNDVNSWEDYQKVARVLLNPTNLFRNGTSNFVMSGSFSSQSNNNDAGNTIYDAEEVIINPGSNDLRNSGSIHLRKTDSYNLFNVKADNNITVTPISWSVYNIPGLCYLYDQEEERNASDDYFHLTQSFSGYNDISYHNSETYESQWFEKGSNNNYSFDFYLLENRHTGIINASNHDDAEDFNLREAEYKIDGENNFSTNKDNIKGTTNTGWYSSLVSEPGTDIPARPSNNINLRNNNASYVVVRLNLSYYYRETDPYCKPVNPQNYPNNNLVFRNADVKYTVHLGYCKGAGLDKVNDFNNFRNCKYTYTLNINGVDNVRLEAMNSEEPQPSVEGIVTDQGGQVIKLDSHYGVVNIKLTDNERKNLIWMLQTPYGENDVVTIIGGNLGENTSVPRTVLDATQQEIKDALPDNQFYNWVQIVPTTGKDVIAPDRGDKRVKSSSSIMYLDDLTKVNGEGNNDEKWYTFYIDEYVYNHKYDSGTPSRTKTEITYKNWGDYVNIGDRKLWIIIGDENMGSFVSNDTESIYNKAKYMISQESIQTYYSPNRIPETCIGLESLNESYISKEDNYWWIDWKVDNTGFSNDNTNGWLNQWTYFQNSQQWSSIYEGNGFRRGLRDKENGIGNPDMFYIPNHTNKYMAACMARNRDLDGDGVIDENEVRWYLPTAETYTRIMLGSAALRDPLFSVKGINKNDDKYANFAGEGAPYTHYVSSDKSMLWAEELAATGSYNVDRAGNLRCIRNLGVVNGKTPEEGIQQAYVHKPEEKAVEMYYYRGSSLRSYNPYPIGPNTLVDDDVYASRKFQYSKDYCKKGTNDWWWGIIGGNLSSDYYDIKNQDLALLNEYNEIPQVNFRNLNVVLEDKLWTKSLQSNSICKYYYEEEGMSDVGSWRVPNITELSIMFFLNILDSDPIDRNNEMIKPSYLSSTYEYFINRNNLYMGINKSDIVSARVLDARVRCVKDIETDY